MCNNKGGCSTSAVALRYESQRLTGLTDVWHAFVSLRRRHVEHVRDAVSACRQSGMLVVAGSARQGCGGFCCLNIYRHDVSRETKHP